MRGGGTPMTVAPKFKPARDRHVPVVAKVACPTCDAQIGEKCHALNGGGGRVQHPMRRKMAVRLNNTERGI